MTNMQIYWQVLDVLQQHAVPYKRFVYLHDTLFLKSPPAMLYDHQSLLDTSKTFPIRLKPPGIARDILWTSANNKPQWGGKSAV